MLHGAKITKIIVEYLGGEPETFTNKEEALSHIYTLKEAYSAYLNDFTVTIYAEIPATFHNPAEEVEQETSGYLFKEFFDSL